MMQLSLELEEENKVLSPLDKLRLPKDKDLPPVIREIVTNAPSNRKIPAFVASLSIMESRNKRAKAREERQRMREKQRQESDSE